MGEGRTGGSADDDPFEALRRAGFFDDHVTAPRELSAEERQRQAARRAREADLHRRLAEEAEHIRRLTERDRRRARTAKIPGVAAARRRRSLRQVAADRRARYGTPSGPSPMASLSRPWRAMRVSSLIAPAVLVVIMGVAWYTQRETGTIPTALGAPGLQRPADYPPIDRSASSTPLGTPPPAPASPGAYEFAMTHEGTDAPVTWDPCRPVRYVINPVGAPPGSDDLVHDAVRRTAGATGLTFEYLGHTDEVNAKQREPYQPDRYDDRWAPLLISWGTEQDQPGLAGYIAGLGGPIVGSDPSGRLTSVSGTVLLDAADLGLAMSYPDGPNGVRAVIQHELGHAMGLDHVADTQQLMHSEGGGEVTDWGSGDLAGLNALGSGECAPDV